MNKQKQVSDLESNNVLSIDLTDVMFSQQTIAGCRAVLDQRGDFTRLVDEAHVAWAVFVHGDGALKWPDHTQTQCIRVQALHVPHKLVVPLESLLNDTKSHLKKQHYNNIYKFTSYTEGQIIM